MAKSPKKVIPQGSSTQKNKETTKKFDSEFATDSDRSLQDLFVSELKDIYWAENHLVKALPKMVDAARSNGLKQALANHLKLTKTHASRLEKIFEGMGEKIVAKKCDAMEGLTMSGEHVIENTRASAQIRDLGIIMSSLKVENFEITTYKGLIPVALSLGKPDIAKLLQQNLDEEIAASNLLTEMSKSVPGKKPA